MTAAVRPTQAEPQRPGKFFAGYAEYLSGLGVPAAEADVLTPLGVLTAYLRQRHAGAAVLTVAEPLVDATLAAAGITVTTEPAAAGVVVVSFDRTFSYPKLLHAYRAVRHFGAAIVATNPDPFCPTRTVAGRTARPCSPPWRRAPRPGHVRRYHPGDLARSPVRPDYVIQGIGQLLPMIRRTAPPASPRSVLPTGAYGDRVRLHAYPPRPHRR